MRDLTVADLHTYYVVAGTTPVLVHNCGGGLWGKIAGLFSRTTPEPNATVGDLRGIELPDVGGDGSSAGKLSALSKMKPRTLLRSVFQPSDGEFMAVNPATGAMDQGNHRAATLMSWARYVDHNGGEGPITWDTPIYIRGFGNGG
jgi:hypothetical protein